MDKEGVKSKSFVSTFRLELKPAARTCCVEKNKGNGVDATGRMVMGNNKAEISNPTGEMVHSNKISCKNRGASPGQIQCSPRHAGMYTGTAENSAAKHPSGSKLHDPAKETSTVCNPELHNEVTNMDPLPENTQPSSRASKNRRKQIKDKGVPVEFVDPPEQVEVRVGEQATLHCDFRTSSVPVACCWIYNREKVVVERPRTSVRSSEKHSSVEISRSCPEDTGLYTIVVRNRRGSAQHTVSLSVIDRPNPPASQPVVSQLTTQSLVLSWTGPSYDGGTAVLGYIVETKQEDLDKPGSWTPVISRCKSTSHQICSGLDPTGTYRFRVRAYNSAGTSEPSKESDCIKMATAKMPKEKKETSYITVTVDTTHKVKEHYNVHEQLGVGKFGLVFRLSHKDTGQECAGKFYKGRTAKERSAALKEIELMNCLHHPKLVQCLAAYNTPSELVMIMEYIAGGELFEHILDDNFEHTEPTSARYMQQILEGMQYVHKQNIVHLDLKPENIVCVDSSGTQIKIIDFGLASKLDPNKPLMVMHGTPEFVAPEVISFEPVSLETDMWSIGVICYILLSGESPFQGNSDHETLALVTAARYEFDEESFEDISDQAKDFISSLLKKDRRCRLSCTEALAHPWMISFTPLNRNRPTKSLNKVKMRRFLAKRKWKKTGKAVLALQRMANLSNRPDSPGSASEEPAWSQEAEEAIQSLDTELQCEPRFHQTLKDTTCAKGATAQLMCLINGYPEPMVKWLHNEQMLLESSRVTTEQHDGFCSLFLADLEPSDSGVYVCRASNDLGEAMCSARLTVEL